MREIPKVQHSKEKENYPNTDCKDSKLNELVNKKKMSIMIIYEFFHFFYIICS